MINKEMIGNAWHFLNNAKHELRAKEMKILADTMNYLDSLLRDDKSDNKKEKND